MVLSIHTHSESPRCSLLDFFSNSTETEWLQRLTGIESAIYIPSDWIQLLGRDEDSSPPLKRERRLSDPGEQSHVFCRQFSVWVSLQLAIRLSKLRAETGNRDELLCGYLNSLGIRRSDRVAWLLLVSFFSSEQQQITRFDLKTLQQLADQNELKFGTSGIS